MRQEIASAIKEAKEQGDLSENAEYTEAKRQQGENERKIAELEVTIKNSQIAEENGEKDKVGLGSRVKVKSTSREMELEIVCSNEANPGAGKISNESPMGKAFMRHQKGDKVEVKTPGGSLKFVIVEVK